MAIAAFASYWSNALIVTVDKQGIAQPLFTLPFRVSVMSLLSVFTVTRRAEL